MEDRSFLRKVPVGKSPPTTATAGLVTVVPSRIVTLVQPRDQGPGTRGGTLGPKGPLSQNLAFLLQKVPVETGHQRGDLWDPASDPSLSKLQSHS